MKLPALNNRGLTLIELIVVITILGLLAAISISITPKVFQGTRDAQRRHDIAQIAIALASFYADNRAFPSCGGPPTTPCNVSVIQAQLSRYINPLPQDPLNTGTYIYQYVQQTPCGSCPAVNTPSVFGSLEACSNANQEGDDVKYGRACPYYTKGIQ